MPRQERTKSGTDIYHLILRDNTPLLWRFGGGYVELNANGTPTSWNYYVTDHLGSTRMVVDSNDSIKEVINYYPFGAIYGDVGTDDALQRYKYNGKELDRMHGLNQYDYGARNYDPHMCRFTQMDPLAENYYNVSPYVYCFNNPVKYIDPDGRDGIISIYGNNITISANVYLYGKGATLSVLKQMQSDVNKVWGKNYSIEHGGKTYNVTFNINMSLYDGKEKNEPLVIADSWNPFSRNNYINITDDDRRSKVNFGDEGVWRSKGRNGKPLSDDDPAPHEVAHLLGLDDQYTDENGPNKGWEGNIMGDSKNGKLDERNIGDILNSVWKEYNKWKDKGNTGEFIYEINP